ncbi:DUF3846 domain-containing protein [Streptomyces althioticus]|uniref:DUF3846 domain-containing protein n=1 Tax=Streptomyces althioticus TaxID=83380 RepID=UPI0038736A40|nr:DUF3846 domain-containing protein [Streptomyces althioticus]WTC27395.1 DUF3846 domain-containing protein [Streptomyces althioticus]
MPAAAFALVLHPDASFQVIEWPRTGNTLSILYREIDCTSITVVDLSPEVSMWLDDEGILKNSPVNFPALQLYALTAPVHQTYHGTAVFTGCPDARGDTKGLTLDNCHALLKLAGIDVPTIPDPRTN